MTAKQIIVLAVGILALGITAWKGPSAWSGISTGIAAIALFVGTLKIVPKEDAEYIQDLEDALAKTSPTTGAAPSVEMPIKSQARFAKSVQKIS